MEKSDKKTEENPIENNSNAEKFTSFEELLEKEGRIIYKNVGISMLPLIRENRDLIIIEKSPDGNYKKYDAVLFKRPGVSGRGEYVLHRILKVYENGTYFIAGDNCYTGETVNKENIMGVLTALVRNGKKITGKDIKYRIYVHLWCDFYRIRCFLLHKYHVVFYRALRHKLKLLLVKLNLYKDNKK